MNYYFDMDGVLIIYDPEAYKGENPKYRQLGIHYFRNLPVDEKMIEVCNILYKDSKRHWKYRHDKIYIVTSVQREGDLFLEHAQDKYFSVKSHLPWFKRKYFIVLPATGSKRDIVASIKRTHAGVTFAGRDLEAHDVLLDDYNPNLNGWDEGGGMALKYLNGFNSPDSFKGMLITQNMSAQDIVDLLHFLPR